MSTPNRFKFRVWDTEAKRYITEVPARRGWLDTEDWDDPEEVMDSLTHYFPNPFRTFGERLAYEQWTGLTDSTGKDIYENDVLQLSPACFEQTLLNPDEVAAGDTPIYEVHQDKPLPAPDVPYARGVVEWGDAGYSLRYTWQCESWSKSGTVSLSLSHCPYALTVLGNIHEHKGLLS